jgi:hypothetical protein
VVKAIVVTLVILAGTCRAAAQKPLSTSSDTSDVSISAGYEVHRDHVRYEFENPSTFNTPFLVPHKFEQTYIANNQWFVGSARYPLLGGMMQSEFGATPTRNAFASDLDTFFNPDNDVIISGTAGNVSMHALRFAQWSEGRMWGIPLRIGYLYRRDVTEFKATDRIVTHSSPPSSEQTPIATHETTLSRVHEVPIGVWKGAAITPRWSVLAGADVSPVVLARLTTILPEKYPGQEILFQAKAAALAARLEFVHDTTHWPVGLSVRYGRTWSYRASSQFSRDALDAVLTIRFRP